jgi:hypothetical protein
MAVVATAGYPIGLVGTAGSAAPSGHLRCDDRALPASNVDEAFCHEKGNGAVDGASGDLVFGGELDHRWQGFPSRELAGFDCRT